MTEKSFVETFVSNVHDTPNKIACSFLKGRKLIAEDFSYSYLHEKAQIVANQLLVNQLSRKKVGILCNNDIFFVISILACFYARAIAVPVPNGALRNLKNRAENIIKSAELDVFLILNPEHSITRGDVFNNNLLELNINHLSSQSTNVNSCASVINNGSADDIALIQYTSGSVNHPKGILISHKNLSINLLMIQNSFRYYSKEDSVTNWLPFYHDMGLVGGLLIPFFVGAKSIQINPIEFLKRPLCWLKTVSRYKSVYSGAPNFAYQLCVDVLNKNSNQNLDLDLSSWKVAFCGSEPILASVMTAFVNSFSPFQFAKESLLPCYGMAEATLIISAAGYQTGYKTYTRSSDFSKNQITFVSCGKILGDQKVKIISDSTDKSDSELEGEILIAGENFFSGYVVDGKIDTTCFYFDEKNERYFPTGDIGFIYQNELYITGRKKQIIIQNGINYYPYDISRYIGTLNNQLDNLKGAVFDFALDNPPINDFKNSVIVIHELKRGFILKGDKIKTMENQIKNAVIKEFGLNIGMVKVVKNGSLPRTSSGKLQMEKCKKIFLTLTTALTTTL